MKGYRRYTLTETALWGLFTLYVYGKTNPQEPEPVPTAKEDLGKIWKWYKIFLFINLPIAIWTMISLWIFN